MLSVLDSACITVAAGSSKGVGLLRCLCRLRINLLAERQKESHNELDPLMQGIVQLAVGGRQTHFLGQLCHRAPQRLLHAHRGLYHNFGIG